jgi:DNA helicase-2/ATP-dependent DNA helicase PcrA
VVQFYHKQNFCEAYDLDFGYDDDEGDVMSADKDEGNALFEIYGWLQSNRYDISEYEKFPREPPEIGDVEHYLELWEQYKEERNLIGFGDMIERVIDKCRLVLEDIGYGPLFGTGDMTHMEIFEEARKDPDRNPDKLRQFPCFVDTKVLYVDEVQDLNPLQWCWYLAQKLVCEKVYIGGDDDQTIYGWSGADPNFMLDEEGDFEVLDKTYRIPANIWEACDKTIRQVDRRQEKEVEPHGDGGEVVKLRRPSPRQIIDELHPEENFILFRANYQIDNFCETLREQGIPYRNESTFDNWSTEVETLRDGLGKMKQADDPSVDERFKLTKDEVSALKDNVPDIYLEDLGSSTEKQDIMSSFNGKRPERVKELFSFPDTAASKGFTWQAYLKNAEELTYYEKECIRGCLIHENYDMDPERVTIGTIHSSKGRESKNVILALDTTQSIAQGMRDETMGDPEKKMSDAERRVYYVGMSRASEKLVLAEGVIDPTMTIQISTLLGEHGRTDGQQTLQQQH